MIHTYTKRKYATIHIQIETHTQTYNIHIYNIQLYKSIHIQVQEYRNTNIFTHLQLYKNIHIQTYKTQLDE